MAPRDSVPRVPPPAFEIRTSWGDGDGFPEMPLNSTSFAERAIRGGSNPRETERLMETVSLPPYTLWMGRLVL